MNPSSSSSSRVNPPTTMSSVPSSSPNSSRNDPSARARRSRRLSIRNHSSHMPILQSSYLPDSQHPNTSSRTNAPVAAKLSKPSRHHRNEGTVTGHSHPLATSKHEVSSSYDADDEHPTTNDKSTTLPKHSTRCENQQSLKRPRKSHSDGPSHSMRPVRERRSRTRARPGARSDITSMRTHCLPGVDPSERETIRPRRSASTPNYDRENSISGARHADGALHAEPDIRGIKLWDERRKIMVLGKVRVVDLPAVLRHNPGYAIYIGQDGKTMRYPGDLLAYAKPAHQNDWMNELRKLPVDRRVMIFDPKSSKLLNPRSCPTLSTLIIYHIKLKQRPSQTDCRRIFNLHYTESYGISERQWESLFSAQEYEAHHSKEVAQRPLRRSNRKITYTYRAGDVLDMASQRPAHRFFSSDQSFSDEELSAGRASLEDFPVIERYSPGRLRTDRREQERAGGVVRTADSFKERSNVYSEMFSTTSSDSEHSGEFGNTHESFSSTDSAEERNVQMEADSMSDSSEAVPSSRVQMLREALHSNASRRYTLHDSSDSDDSLFGPIERTIAATASRERRAKADVSSIPDSQFSSSSRTLDGDSGNAISAKPSNDCRKGSIPVRIRLHRPSHITDENYTGDSTFAAGGHVNVADQVPGVSEECTKAREHDDSSLVGPRRTESRPGKSAIIFRRRTSGAMLLSKHTRELNDPEKEVHDVAVRSASVNASRNDQDEKEKATILEHAISSPAGAEKAAVKPTRVSAVDAYSGPLTGFDHAKATSISLLLSEENQDNRADDNDSRVERETANAEIGSDEIEASRLRTSDDAALNDSSEEAYIWDYTLGKKSLKPFPLRHAIAICENDDQKTIYDGQDLKTGDPRFKEMRKEHQAWNSRRGTRPGKSRKVRVWDHCMGEMEQFHFSPKVHQLSGWLKDNPSHSIFRPSLLMRYERRVSTKGLGSGRSSADGKFRRAVITQVLGRIRQLGLAQVSDGPLQDLVLWNIHKRKQERPRCFQSRLHLTRYLFLNPALELMNGQDGVARLERTTEMKLICVSLSFPADIVHYWEEESKSIKAMNTIQKAASPTILKCLRRHPNWEVYLGQDTDEADSVRRSVRSLQRSFPGFGLFTLTRCGGLVQRQVYARGWIPTYIDEDKENSMNAAFWCTQKNEVVVEPQQGQIFSVREYLEAFPKEELYVGQDLPKQVQTELKQWFSILQLDRRHASAGRVRVLLRWYLIPLLYRAVRFTSGEEYKVLNTVPRRRRKRTHSSRRELNSATSKLQETPSLKDESSGISKRQRLSLRIRNTPQEGLDNSQADSVEDNCNSDPVDKVHVRVQGRPDGSKNPSQNMTSKDNATAPSASTLHTDPSISESEVEEDFIRINGSPLRLEGSEEIEDHLQNATKLGKKMICSIREAGPRILKRELKHDLRQNLREQLILEIESTAHLANLVKEFGSMEFVSSANKLYEELQLLDVHECFSENAELTCSLYDLSSIGEDFRAGRICTSHDVIKRFRKMSADLIHLHHGTLLGSQAILLKCCGEEVISNFENEDAKLLEKERQMLRLFRICERAKHIGFRNSTNSRKSKQQSSKQPVGYLESSLRLGTGQPEVTFLNYRDEKGNSVMGKRPSVRVFGFTIDTKSLEESVGQARPCHTCGKEVLRSKADSLRCSNHILHFCVEVMCKTCLENVYLLEGDEFKALRRSDNWFCVHCRGLCPSGSECMRRLQLRDSERSLDKHTRTVRLRWMHDDVEQQEVSMAFIRRRCNGTYDPFSDHASSKKIPLTKDSSENSWVADLVLPIGVYRCQVFVNGTWIASSTFHVVWGHSTPARESNELRKSKRAPEVTVTHSPRPSTLGTSLRDNVMTRTKLQIHRIRWHCIPKFSASPVHAIRNGYPDDGGTLVKQCSRTEGYDWRRAKKQATLQWIPELRTANRHRNSESEHEFVPLCAVDCERAHFLAKDGPPTPRVGVSHRDFLIELNTFRYERMLKSLWAIVTGKSNIHGIGLFTLTGYRVGDFVIEYAGDLIRTPLADIREARYESAGLGTYLFKINENQIVDATVKSNRARFTNHSCDPNMVADIVHVRGRDLIVLRATREIPRYTELTFDYKFPYEEAKLQCLCNSWNCVGVMN